MFRNGEGYPDPTAGAALARITYEEHQKRKKARHGRNRVTKRKSSESIQIIWLDYHNDQLHWIKAWPKETNDATKMNAR